MPLSEEEQRILHEMEQKLYENDRSFANRVRVKGPRSAAHRSIRWSALVFAAGFIIVVVSFRSSLLLATFGFLVMLLAALAFEHSGRQVLGHDPKPQAAHRPLADELAMIGKRLRSRPKFRRDR